MKIKLNALAIIRDHHSAVLEGITTEALTLKALKVSRILTTELEAFDSLRAKAGKAIKTAKMPTELVARASYFDVADMATEMLKAEGLPDTQTKALTSLQTLALEIEAMADREVDVALEPYTMAELAKLGIPAKTLMGLGALLGD